MFTLEHNSPVIAVITGLEHPSRNMKTGAMLQSWIIRDDMNPIHANVTGADEAICGQCPFRGTAGKQRACYVNLGRAPIQIYKRLESSKPLDMKQLYNRDLRFGAYGDPVFISLPIMAEAAKRLRSWTGYTHSWQTCDQDYKKYLMASVETEEGQPILQGESVCPASDEAGKKLQCITCGRCNGTQSKKRDVVIIAHGQGRKYA